MPSNNAKLGPQERGKNNVAFRSAKVRSFTERKATICPSYSSRVPKTISQLIWIFIVAILLISTMTPGVVAECSGLICVGESLRDSQVPVSVRPDYVKVAHYIAENTSPTVGAAGNIEQIILPGSELAAKPLVSHSPMVVRIVTVFPHGDSFRYDIVFHGLEPGKYNLADWLVRKDGSTTQDLPEIPVEVKSLLPPGQIEPNELETGWIPRLGGYRNVMIGAILLWSLILLGLIFLGRKKPEAAQEQEQTATLADMLRARLEAALENRMGKEQYAELERMLFAYWRKRLQLESRDPASALRHIHDDPQAGPLMQQLEQWMHNPAPDQDVDLAMLLEPFRNLPADTPGFES